MASVIRIRTDGDSTGAIKVKTEGTARLNAGGSGVTTGTVVKKGYSPYINPETGTWWEYDDKTHAFVDTGVIAEIDHPINDVSDEFIISDDKILYVNEISASKIDGLVDIINDTVQLPDIATAEIPGLVLSSNQENNVLVLQNGVMVVNDINVNKLVQTPGERFTLNGGSSTD